MKDVLKIVGGIFSVLFLFLLVGVVVHSGNDETALTKEPTQVEAKEQAKEPEPKVEPNPEPKIEVIEVTSMKLYADYKANELAADKMYKGKMLKVTGKINDISNDIFDNPFITLHGDGFINDIQCLFDDKHNDELASMEKGQVITIQGKCSGITLLNVMIEDCNIVK